MIMDDLFWTQKAEIAGFIQYTHLFKLVYDFIVFRNRCKYMVLLEVEISGFVL